jgi:hypothetical protein
MARAKQHTASNTFTPLSARKLCLFPATVHTLDTLQAINTNENKSLFYTIIDGWKMFFKNLNSVLKH